MHPIFNNDDVIVCKKVHYINDVSSFSLTVERIHGQYKNIVCGNCNSEFNHLDPHARDTEHHNNNDTNRCYGSNCVSLITQKLLKSLYWLPTVHLYGWIYRWTLSYHFCKYKNVKHYLILLLARSLSFKLLYIYIYISFYGIEFYCILAVLATPYAMGVENRNKKNILFSPSWCKLFPYRISSRSGEPFSRKMLTNRNHYGRYPG